MSAGAFLIGRDANGVDRAVRVNDDGFLQVDVAGATLELDASGIEIKNDEGNPVPMSDAGSSLTIDSKAYRSAVTITRPNNTTAYAARSVIGAASGSAIITLADAGPSGGYVLVQSARLLIGAASVPSGMAGFRLHLYTASPTAIADGAAFNLASDEVASYVGSFDFPTPQDFGSIIVAQVDYIGMVVKLAAGQTSLFAELETLGGHIPSASALYDLRVMTLEAGL